MAKVKHIVLVKFKEGIGEDQIEKLFDEVLDVSESIPGIEDYVSGSNSSPEQLNQNFTHGFVMTFSDAAARDAYLTHPEHEKLKESILGAVESVLAFDFEV